MIGQQKSSTEISSTWVLECWYNRHWRYIEVTGYDFCPAQASQWRHWGGGCGRSGWHLQGGDTHPIKNYNFVAEFRKNIGIWINDTGRSEDVARKVSQWWGDDSLKGAPEGADRTMTKKVVSFFSGKIGDTISCGPGWHQLWRHYRPVPVIVIVIREYQVFVRGASAWQPTIQIPLFYNEKHVTSIAYMLTRSRECTWQLATWQVAAVCNFATC